MTQFKVGDILICMDSLPVNLTVGKEYRVVSLDCDGWPIVVNNDGVSCWYRPSRFKLKTQNMKLEITKEKVLEAAAKCSTAKETLKTLFPEVFNEECEIKWDERKGAFKINGFTALYVETGEFGRKGLEFHLDSNFDWEIKDVSMGKRLIPTRK